MEKIATEIYSETIERFCSDFDYFCKYLIDNKIKLSKNTCQIGKKACYEINQNLRRSEKYEKAGRQQERYMVIHFMYYIAFTYQILDMDPGKGYVIPGSKYEIYEQASSIEKYLLFFTSYIYDGTCWGHYEFTYRHCMQNFLMWVQRNYEEEQSYRIPARILGMYDDSSKSTVPVLEELGLIELQECVETRRCIEECKIKVFPIMNLLAKMYHEAAAKREKRYETKEDIQNYLKDYLEYFAPNQNTGFFEKLYEEVPVERKQQTILIEVAMRYYDCSREILLSSNNTLADLHLLIQEAFEFDNDHLYEFYVGKGMFRKSYCMEEAVTSGEELSAEDTCLGELPICKGFSFEYLFDFGDSWWFDLKIKECTDENEKAAKIVKRNGKAPEQYRNEW